jgi:hypothetical protein
VESKTDRVTIKATIHRMRKKLTTVCAFAHGDHFYEVAIVPTSANLRQFGLLPPIFLPFHVEVGAQMRRG